MYKCMYVCKYLYVFVYNGYVSFFVFELLLYILSSLF